MDHAGMNDPLIRWLYGLRGPSLKWDIETARAFTAWLGHPHRLYPSVHVAGTNGKGSVCAMLHAVGQRAGLTCGLSTSPHLVRPEERIRVGEADIDAERFTRLIVDLREEAGRALAAGALERHPSFFEMLTAAAMRAFAERPVDLAIFETGLGGRLDATNVLSPLVSIVTTIGSDHLKTLGGSIEAVAREKGGIIKPGIPVLVGNVAGKPLAVLREIAGRIGAPLHLAADEIELDEHDDGTFDVVTPERSYERLACALAGRHQRANAALVVRAAELVRERGVPLSPGDVRDGIATVRWAGRLEAIDGAPRFLLDAAHNAEGIDTLARYLVERDLAEGRPSRRALVFALTDGRDPATTLAPLAPLIDAVVITRPDTPRAQPPVELAARLRGAHPRVTVREPVRAALDRAAAAAGPDGEVVVTGSLYLVGDARRTLLGLSGPGHVRREVVPDIAPPTSADGARP